MGDHSFVEDLLQGHMNFSELWARHVAKRTSVTEGVSHEDVDAGHLQRLGTLIDAVKAGEPPDYHPGSNGVVRDIVHPSLYPFILGTSPVQHEEEVEVLQRQAQND